MSDFLEIEGEDTLLFDTEKMDQKYREAIGFGDAPPIWLKNYDYETLLFMDSSQTESPSSGQRLLRIHREHTSWLMHAIDLQEKSKPFVSK